MADNSDHSSNAANANQPASSFSWDFSALNLLGMPKRDAGKVQSPTPPEASETDKKGPTLLTLPQEVQDVIFDLAYPKQDGIVWTSRTKWEYNELDRQRQDRAGYTPSTCPAPKVNEWLINKRFFKQAASAYVANHRVFTEADRLADTVYSELRFGSECGLFSVFLPELHCDFMICHSLHKFSNLHVLVLTVDEKIFEDLEPTKFVWEDELNQEDLDKVIKTTRLGKISGLKSFTLKGTSRYANTPLKKAMWEENLEALELALKPVVTRERVSRANSDKEAIPLYDGSEVNMFVPAGQELTHFSSNGSGSYRAARGTSKLEDLVAQFVAQSYEKEAKKKLSEAPVSDYARLDAADIPETINEFKMLLETNGQGVMDWVRRMKYP